MNENAKPQNTGPRSPYRVLTCQLITEMLCNASTKKLPLSPTPNSPELAKINDSQTKDSPILKNDPFLLDQANQAVDHNGISNSLYKKCDLAESWNPESRSRSIRRAATSELFYTSNAFDCPVLGASGNFTSVFRRTSELEAKGPIEARMEKYMAVDKKQFQPKRGSFSSPKIVKADIKSAFILAAADKLKKSGMSTAMAAYSSPIASKKTMPSIEQIYKLANFQRRVSTSILLDNFRVKGKVNNNNVTPRKTSSQRTAAETTPEKSETSLYRQFSLTHLHPFRMMPNLYKEEDVQKGETLATSAKLELSPIAYGVIKGVLRNGTSVK